MEFLSTLIDGLAPPWSQKARSLLIPDVDFCPLMWEHGSSVSAFGHVTRHGGYLRCNLAKFEPFVGVTIVQPCFSATIIMDEPSTFPIGSWIGFNDLRVDFVDKSMMNALMSCTDLTSIWNLAELQTEFPINMTHLFAGAFSGWERSSNWMNDQNIVKIQQSMAIDHCCTVMQIWQLRNDSPILNSNIPVVHDHRQKHLGVLSDIGGGTWPNLCRFQNNHILTASPPCQPFSRGGKSQGLECSNGVPFAATVWRIRTLRPLAACFECSDMTPNHPHFPILSNAMRVAGYKCVWSEVIHLEKISSMSRSRWLAVWIRLDVLTDVRFGNFKLVDAFRKSWNASEYDFDVPDQINHQLVLNKSLLGIYGNFDFLPPNKKLFFSGKNPSEKEVLGSRCLSVSAVMPTLVASYSQQHCIDESHLIAKGIFASLTIKNGDVAFFDPFRFVCLLGATTNEIVPIPIKIDIAFHNLGNAISVPQALLCICIACKSLGLCCGQISSIIAKCWSDRFLSTKACILRNADFAFVVPFALIQKVVGNHCIPRVVNPVIFLDIDGRFFEIANEDEIFFERIFTSCGFDIKNIHDWELKSNDMCIPWSTCVSTCIDVSFEIIRQSEIIFKGTFTRSCNEDSTCDSLDIAIRECIGDIEQKLGKDSSNIEGTHEIHTTDSFVSQLNVNISQIATAVSEPNQKRFKTSDVENAPTCMEKHFENQVRGIYHHFERDQRLLQFIQDGSPLASDEISFIKRNVVDIGCTESYHDFYHFDEFCKEFPAILKRFVGGNENFVVLLIHSDNHWFACELENPKLPSCTCVGAFDKHTHAMCDAAALAFVASGKKTNVQFVNIPSPPKFCGWSLIHRWVWKQGIKCNEIDLNYNEANSRAVASFGPRPRNKFDACIWELAVGTRDFFLCSKPHWDPTVVVGSANDDDQSMSQGEEKQLDPWLKNDPWSGKRQCKWEDLKLPVDHHFKLKSGDPIKQVTRQQIGANNAGIAFCTKANVVGTFQTGPPVSTSLLVPASEKISFDCEPPLKIQGPFEIIVHDDALGSIYKRQVLLVQQQEEVSHQLPVPKYNSTAPALSEIVIEVHESLISKEVASSIGDKPLDTFKKIVIEQFPNSATKNLHVYAFRVTNTSGPNRDLRIFQVMCKIPTSSRNACLERSGAGDAFFRDFVAKGESIQDLSTLPKFWNHDRHSKDNALRAASSIEGFAGLTLTRRGIAVRSWNSKIGYLRKVLFADDERISSVNLDVIPKLTRESTGWPSSIGAAEVVKATSHETGSPPIPTRCYKALGVTTWTLTFQDPPKKTRFLINFNGKAHEILITEPNEHPKEQLFQKKGKGKTKGKGKGYGEKSIPNFPKQSKEDDPTNQRLSVLEAKFCTMERRQDGLEAKINEGFAGVNDQLRQVLHAMQPRSAVDATGSTPPPKMPKTGNN